MLRIATVMVLTTASTGAWAQEQQPARVGPAVSQAESGRAPQRIRSVTLTGNQPCPRSTADEVVVCSRQNPNEQFRIPKPLRDTAEPKAQNQAWANRTAVADTVGREASGLPDTCSPVGAGGQTGCALKWNRAYAAEKRAAANNDAMVP